MHVLVLVRIIQHVMDCHSKRLVVHHDQAPEADRGQVPIPNPSPNASAISGPFLKPRVRRLLLPAFLCPAPAAACVSRPQHLAAADFQREAAGAVEHGTEFLLQYRSHFADRGTHHEDGGCRLLCRLAYRFQGNLDRFGILAVEVAECVVDLRHENFVPLLNRLRWERHMGIEPAF